MIKKISIITIITAITLVVGFTWKQELKTIKIAPQAEKITLNGFENLYKISPEVYRSEQPDKNGMKELEKLGVKTILSLREYHTDDNEVMGTNLMLKHVPIDTKEISYNHIFKALTFIKNSEKPVLVHCLHGSDRTGCVIAAYRMVFENWSKKDAIKEFRNEAFGYHESWFPNIMELLTSLDVKALQRDMGIEAIMPLKHN